MKKTVIFLLVLCLLLVTGCAETGGPDSTGVPPGDTGDSAPGGQPDSAPGGGEEPSSPSNPVPAENELRWLLGEAGWTSVVETVGFVPNSFVKHPDGRILFYEAEFEEPTHLWIYEPGGAEQFRELLPAEKLPQATAIKGVCWPDEHGDEILLILGHRYGTVSPGGDVYRLDLTSKILSPFYKTGDAQVQVTGMAPQGESLLLTLATFDSNMEHPQSSQKTVPLFVQSSAVGAVTGEAVPQNAVGLARESLPEDTSFRPAQTLHLDDSGESVLIVPRYTGSTVRVYSVKYQGGDFIQTGWLGAYYNTADGWALNLETMLPEGGPVVKVVISCFGKTGSFLVAYDGRGESPVRWVLED